MVTYRDTDKEPYVNYKRFYGGDFNTLHANKGFPIEEAKQIYDAFMGEFKGIANYQNYCRKVVMDKGYILMNPILGHRAHIYDIKLLSKVQSKFNEDGFWAYYRDMKKSAPYCETVTMVKKYFKRKSECERQSINYRVQNRGACAFKLALIKFFNWLIKNNYQNIIKICIVAHDEINIEVPENIKDLVSKTLVQCMVEGGKPFCRGVNLGADVEISDHWIH